MAYERLTAAIKDNLEEDAEALWLDDTLTPLDRAKALYYALLWQKYRIAEWLLDHFDVPVNTGEALLKASGMDNVSYFATLFAPRQCPSEGVLRAAIRNQVAFERSDCVVPRLHEAGGWDLVAYALDEGYELKSPISTWFWDPEIVSGLDKDMISELWRLGFSALPQLSAFHAVHTKDKKGLVRAIRGDSESARSARAYILPYALQQGWVEFVRLQTDARQLSLPFSYLSLRCAMEAPTLATVDLLLELGDDWKAAAFWAAFLEGNVNALDHVVEWGGVGLPGTPIPPIPFDGLDGEDVPRIMESPNDWAAEMAKSSTLGGLLPVGVVALVDAAKARCLEPLIYRWRQTALLVMVWLRRQCHAYGEKRGGGSWQTPDLPHVPARILGHAGIPTSEEWRNATPLAARMCEWLWEHESLWEDSPLGRQRPRPCQDAGGGGRGAAYFNARAAAPVWQGFDDVCAAL